MRVPTNFSTSDIKSQWSINQSGKFIDNIEKHFGLNSLQVSSKNIKKSQFLSDSSYNSMIYEWRKQ